MDMNQINKYVQYCSIQFCITILTALCHWDQGGSHSANIFIWYGFVWLCQIGKSITHGSK